MDFKSHYATRKSVYRTIQARQRSESQTISAIGQSAVSGNAEILKYLSDWILGIQVHNSRGYEFEAEWDSTTSISLTEWLILQTDSRTIGGELGQAQSAEWIADREYYNVATCGDLTKIWAGFKGETDKKQQIETLERQCHSAKAQREAVEARKNANIAARQSLGETFLRDCLRNMDVLMQSPTFGQRITYIMEKTAAEMKSAWQLHKNSEMQSIDSMISSLEQLRSSYANHAKMEETPEVYATPQRPNQPSNDLEKLGQKVATPATPNKYPGLNHNRETIKAVKNEYRVKRLAYTAPSGGKLFIILRRDTSVFIGRSPNSTIVLDSPLVSSSHARITFSDQNGKWFITDLGSSGGTYVANKRIGSGKYDLCEGDQIRVGTHVLEVTK